MNQNQSALPSKNDVTFRLSSHNLLNERYQPIFHFPLQIMLNLAIDTYIKSIYYYKN
jgi:hypothetical protein